MLDDSLSMGFHGQLKKRSEGLSFEVINSTPVNEEVETESSIRYYIVVVLIIQFPLAIYKNQISSQ